MNRILVLASVACMTALACRQPATAPKALAVRTPLKQVKHVDPPALQADKPANYPGLHNVVTYSDGLYSGSVPEGDEGFDTLVGMGVRTIISVDGALPEVDEATARGMRYVHLPIGYNGMGAERTLEIAKAIHDLPGPVYVHCHHGKHRSAGATAAAAVTLGKLSTDAATARMKVSGTAPNYTGLYKCAAVAAPVDERTLAALPAYFPERSSPTGLVQSMTAIDEANDELKAIEKAGWKTPADHLDLVPVAIAGRMADLFRTGAEDNAAKAHSQEFRDWLLAESKQLEAIEAGLASGTLLADELSKRMKAVQQSCKDCHAKYRD